MLLPGGPFHFNGPIAIRVKDPAATARWYEVVLNLNCLVGSDMVPTGMYNPTDAANPQPQIAFVQEPRNPLAPKPAKPVIFARNIDEAHRWLSARIATTGAMQADSAGNRFFSFQDLDGNAIEVCADPKS